MPAGTVKFYNAEKGFGFVVPDDGRDDIFFHRSAYAGSGADDLRVADFIEFDVELDPRTGKFVATNIDLIRREG